MSTLLFLGNRWHHSPASSAPCTESVAFAQAISTGQGRTVAGHALRSAISIRPQNVAAAAGALPSIISMLARA